MNGIGTRGVGSYTGITPRSDGTATFPYRHDKLQASRHRDVAGA